MGVAGLGGLIDYIDYQARKDMENKLDNIVSLFLRKEDNADLIESLKAFFLRSEDATDLIEGLKAEKVARGDHHLAYYRARLEVLKAMQVAITEDMLTTAEQMGFWD